jgi:cell division protein FtsB
MKCPVCSASGIPDDALQCPQCLSDLEAFHLTNEIEKSNRRKSVGVILASVLFLVILFIWIFTFFIDSGDVKDPEKTIDSNEMITLKAENDKLTADFNALKSENSQLKERLKALAVEKASRQKDYKILYGETLYSISRKVYGNGFKYVDLAKDNKIEDPNQIKAGETLVIYY